MKRLLTLLALVLCSCAETFVGEEIARPNNENLPDLTASFADEDATRTYVENNKYLRWHEDDRLTAFYGNTLNRQYKFNGATGDNSGTFSLVPSGELGTGNAFDHIYALYPYNADARITDEGVISLTLPAVQNYAENSFGRGANTMIAVTENLEDTFLAFKNACGYLKIKLYNAEGASIKSIEVKGNSGERLAGAATATIAFGEALALTLSDDATTSVTLNCGEGVALGTTAETATEFWIVLPATTFAEGLTITVTDTEGGIFEKSTTNEVVIERNAIQPMAALNAEFVINIPKPANNEIWYTTTDGQPIDLNAYSEEYGSWFNCDAFEGNVVSNSYINGKGIIIFDKPINKIGDSDGYIPTFRFYETLKSLTIPEGVIDIADRSFELLPALETLFLPSTLDLSSSSCRDVSLGILFRCPSLREIKGSFATDDGRAWIQDGVMYLFASAGLTSYTVPEEVKELGDELFHECKELTSLTLPNGLLVIGDSSIRYCTGLTTLDIPETVHTIGSCAISFCESLMALTIPSNVTTLQFDSLSGNKSLQVLTLHEGLISIDNMVFDMLYSLKSITIPATVNKIGRCLYGATLSEIYFSSTTPPVLTNGSPFIGQHYNQDARIYVPSGCGTTYKTAWPNLEDIIMELTPDSNEIWYTSTEKVIPYDEDAFNAQIVTNEWNEETGKGIITFDGDLNQIGMSAFQDCENMTSITLPNSITSIGRYAFEGCGLTSFTFPTSLTEIGDCALSDCPIETIVCNIDSKRLEIIPDDDYSYYRYSGIGIDSHTLNKIEGKYVSSDGRCLIIGGTLYAFAGKDIPDTYTLPSNIRHITSYVLSDFEFRELELNASIDSSAFHSSKIDKLTLLGGTVSERSFQYATIEELIIKNGVYVCDEAFYTCYGESLYIDTDIVYGDWSDDYWPPYYYTSYNKVIFGPNVKKIGESAFSNKIDYVYSLASTPPTIDPTMEYPFPFITDKVYVPFALVDTYKVEWGLYSEIIEGFDSSEIEVASYTLTLNNQWRLSNSASNPDSSLYDGVYESYSNYNVNNGVATMYIDIDGYSEFSIYVRSNAESSYDYVTVSELDSTTQKMSTSGKQNSGTAISNYTKVTYTGIDGGKHRITVIYKKDSSQHSGTDRGYLIIPKNQ